MRALALLAATLALSCGADETPFARARVIESLDQAGGGPRGGARVGDFLLENDQLRAVIEQGHVSYLPTDVGGTLIDLDLVRTRRDLRAGANLNMATGRS